MDKEKVIRSVSRKIEVANDIAAKLIALEVEKSIRLLISKPGVSRPGNPPGLGKGNLRRSISASSRKDSRWGYRLSILGKKYGRYLNLGTVKMLARPFIRPGPKKALAKVKEIYKAALSRAKKA